jgi:D-glycero-D-manno-heptose 1,7-bisphosphate phosphatase
MSQARALFLDRDGVINIDHGYVCQPGQFEFVDGIFALCRQAAGLGYRIVVVTNQAGIGRGYYTEQEFHALSDWMCRQFLAQGVAIDGVYFCPYHPEHGIGEYRRESEFRKPGPGMILQAAREHGLDLAASCLVGDKASDIQAGLAAGVGLNILYRPENAQYDRDAAVDAVVVGSLEEACAHLAGTAR